MKPRHIIKSEDEKEYTILAILLFLLIFGQITNFSPQGKRGWDITQGIAEKYFNGISAGDNYGYSVSGAGDVNNDGYDDIIIGALNYSSNKGRVYLYLGGRIINTKPDLMFTGENNDDNFGSAVASAGDVNGDGYDDLIIGARGYSNGRGKAYIYYGGSGMDETADKTFAGSTEQSHFGGSVSGGGDLNGDGYDDIIIGAYGSNNFAGEARIYFGGLNMDESADILLSGSASDDYFGYSVSGVGDLNGDGYCDAIIGAGGANSYQGQVKIYFGSSSMDDVADLTLNRENASDHFGKSATCAGDINGDGYKDVIVGAEGYDADGEFETGKAYIFWGGANMDATADRTLSGETAFDYFGISAACAGDVNGDGFDDVIIGAYLNDETGTDAGKSYVYFGGENMDINVDIMNYGENNEDNFGFSVSAAGDMNGDGLDDYLVGANQNDNNGSNSGRAYLFCNSITGRDVNDLFITGESSSSYLGYSVSFAGDVNGDGDDDVIIGALGYSIGQGRAYIMYGRTDENNSPSIMMTGENNGDYFGKSVSGAGDINGDGYDDVIVGASGNDNAGSEAGRAYIYFGSAVMDNIIDLVLHGSGAGDEFGLSVSGAGDVNGDGFSDVIVGAHYNDDAGTDAGKALLYFGGSGLNNTADITFEGENAYDDFGFSVSGAGDVNGDGFDDVIIGARYSDDRHTDGGKVYIYFGGVNMNNVADIVFTSEADYDNFGYSVSGAGDVNGDGYSDVIIGARYNDGVTTDAGRAYLYFGGQNMDNSGDVIFNGNSVSDYFGSSVSSAGDLNNDDYDDVIIGSYNTGENGKGKAVIFYGGSSMDNIPDMTIAGEKEYDSFGISVSGAGDANSDGFDDFVIGAKGNDDNGISAGKAYIYYSNPPQVKPRLVSASDITNDEGGYVLVKWVRSGYDFPNCERLDKYILQRSAPPAGGDFCWENITEISPVFEKYYTYTVNTWSDSSENANGTMYFRILARGIDEDEIWISNIESGHSVDNIAPGVVAKLNSAFSGGSCVLNWSPNSESDLKNYEIFRSKDSNLDPDTASVFAVAADTTYTDNDPGMELQYYYVRAVDIHGNCGAAASTSPGLLPIELITFTARIINGSVLLEWTTATEIDNYGFFVERGVTRTLGELEGWAAITFIPGAGNSNSPKEYSFTDDLKNMDIIPDTIYYRLKQVNTSGQSEYSEIVSVETQDFASLPAQFKLHQNYPNPFNPVTKIKYSVGQICNLSCPGIPTTLKIYNILGAEVTTLMDETKSPGNYEVKWDATGYSSGIYFCVMKSGEYSDAIKIMLLK